MAYKIPDRISGRAMSRDSKSHFNVRINAETRRRMARHTEVLWAQVCRDAIENILARKEREE